MKQTLTSPLAVAILAIILIGVAILGFQVFSGSKPGTKPPLNPVLNRMYGAHPNPNDAPAPSNPPAQGQ